MKFAIDGMGGDNAPIEIVKGCVDAVLEYDVDLIITGDEGKIKEELNKYNYPKDKIEVIGTSEVIDTNEAPVMAIRKKKDSSLRRAIDLVANGTCEGIVSAGSTGALLAGGLFIIGRIKGIDRPALAPLMPGKNGRFMVLDVGANADCKPINLHQFAHMGKIYFESILGHINPKVGLINIGIEEEKGNELTKATYQLLKNDKSLNFVGNIEPRDIPEGDIQVLVADGFTGNTVLKLYEGTFKVIMDILKASLKSSIQGKIGGLLIKKPLKESMKKYDYKEEGGSAFLGLKGIVVKAHGSSDARAIKNAIRQAKKFHESGLIDKFTEEIQKNMLPIG